ncbi:MAG TPA: hypothetical protein ENI20_16155 [Bacteroides sp.]|nr:hypothetical protein [Bacteroides sp.]
MRLFLILIFQCVLIHDIHAQDTLGAGIRRNMLYIEAETLLMWGNVSINYEGTSLPGKDKVRYSMCLAFGLGYFLRPGTTEREPSFYDESGFVFKIKSYFIWPSGFEIGLGYSLYDLRYSGGGNYGYVSQPYKIKRHIPIISLGHRRIDRPFLFKIHFGTSGLGLSFGYSF